MAVVHTEIEFTHGLMTKRERNLSLLAIATTITSTLKFTKLCFCLTFLMRCKNNQFFFKNGYVKCEDYYILIYCEIPLTPLHTAPHAKTHIHF